MKLAKALKTKNRLAGEIAQLQRMIIESNVTEGSNEPAHDVEKLYGEILTKQDRLAELKARITKANFPIAYEIAMMAELKGHIAFLRGIPTKDGEFLADTRYGVEAKPRVYHARISASRVEAEVRACSSRIELLQDKIDEYNAITEI